MHDPTRVLVAELDTSVSVQDIESSTTLESSNMNMVIAAAKSSIQTRELTSCSGAVLTVGLLTE